MAQFSTTARNIEPMVTSDNCSDTHVHRIVIRPNRSLSWRQSMIFLALIAVPLLLVSGALAFQGFWLILPFAGLELAALFACIYMVSHASLRCEVVSIGDSKVTVEKGRERGRDDASGGPEQRTEFVRAWARVELSGSVDNWYPRRLWIGESGRRVEIGEFLIDDEKKKLATRLRRWLAA